MIDDLSKEVLKEMMPYHPRKSIAHAFSINSSDLVSGI